MLTYCVTDLDGKELSSLSPSKAMMPASNVKLFTSALAFENFDPNLSPARELELLIEDNKLQINFHGNLFLSARYREKSNFTLAIDQLTKALISTGINEFDSLHLHCEYEFLLPLKDYPCVSFISLNENTLDISIEDGKVISCPDSQRTFEFIPSESCLQQSRNKSTITYNPKKDSTDFWRLESDNWTFAILKNELQKRGISIAKQSQLALQKAQLIEKFSDPISTYDLVKSSLRFSDNFRAELLALHLRKVKETKSFNDCFQDLQSRLLLRNTHLADGSGLSRENTSSCRDICSLLHHMHHSEHRKMWHDSLAVSGQSGTLLNTKNNLLPKDRFWGKTGTLRDVRALSGYYKCENGSIVIVSVLQNHANCGKFSESVIKLLREIDEKQKNPN
jgi:D-alanyl-D-alanine carboxypeptidase